MRIKYGKDHLLVVPETDFEYQVIDSYRDLNAFVKCGVSPADVIGIKIYKVDKPAETWSAKEATEAIQLLREYYKVRSTGHAGTFWAQNRNRIRALLKIEPEPKEETDRL